LGHAVGAEEVDGEVALDRGTVAQVVVHRHAGVVDEDVQRVDDVDRSLNLVGVGDVESDRRDAPIGVVEGLAGAGVHLHRASP
jgi:hypothetical protein